LDLLIERGGRFIAVECKYAETVHESDLKGMKALSKAYGPESLIAGYIASRTPRPYSLSHGIKNVPGSFINKVL